MIWTEIKNSINSNLRKPLDKLIEEKVLELNSEPDAPLNEQLKKSYSIHKVENGGSLKTTTEILNIQGKGWLRSLYSNFYSYTGVPIKLIVEVDGNEKINISNQNSSVSSTFTIANVSEKYGVSIMPIRSSVPYADIKDFYDISDNITNNNYRTPAAMLYKNGLGIKFEKSLKITMQSNTDESGKFQCEYILE